MGSMDANVHMWETVCVPFTMASKIPFIVELTVTLSGPSAQRMAEAEKDRVSFSARRARLEIETEVSLRCRNRWGHDSRARKCSFLLGRVRADVLRLSRDSLENPG